MKSLSLGTRGSKLALAQAELAVKALRNAHSTLNVHLHVIKTAGDKAPEKSLSEIGGAGVFVKEIEIALLRGEIDAAVHSAKDLPSQLPEGLTIAACLPRGDARDALVMSAGAGWLIDVNLVPSPFTLLPHGARVGTGSVRRAAFIRMHRPDANVIDMRGNVDSRMQRLMAGEFDALVLAMAGLARLSHLFDSRVRVIPIPTEYMLPAVAQGTLAIEARANDTNIMALLSAIDHAETHAALRAERAYLSAFGAVCQAPIAAYAQVNGNTISMRGAVGLPNGTVMAQGEGEGNVDQSEATGVMLAKRVMNAGGQTILDVMRNGVRPLAGWRVALTRTTARGESLAVRLRALGATPFSAPVITHAPPKDEHPLDEAVRALCEGKFDWMVLTSANTADVIAMKLTARGCVWPAPTRIAVVGEATARACEDALKRQPDCMPAQYDATSLAAAMSAMSNSQNERVCLPNADIAQPTLQTALQAADMQVDRVIAYRTVCNELSNDVKAGLRDEPAHAVMFTSSSTVQCFASQIEDRGAIAVCIGRQTAQAAANAGFAHVVTALAATEDDMIAALLRVAKNHGTLTVE